MKRTIGTFLLMLPISLITFSEAYAECSNNIIPTTPDGRFEIHSDGTVTDESTGLMWMRCSIGQTWSDGSCTGSVNRYVWKEAISAAEVSVEAGYDDWRLPNIKELSSIVEEACSKPAINETIFPDTPAISYWSNSPVFGASEASAWRIPFSFGKVSAHVQEFDTSAFGARLVRDTE